MKEDKQPVYVAPTIEQYRKMTPAQKRITIAKDVIAMLNTEIYVAHKGSYIDEFTVNGEVVSDPRWDKWDTEWIDKDIQQMLPEMKECKVCALGGCILSITKYENKLKIGDVGGALDKFTEATDNLIKEVFSPEQLLIIESMFEGDGGTKYGKRLDHTLDTDVDEDNDDQRIEARCGTWYQNHTGSAEQRMRDIFTILIEHGGEIDVDKL